MPEIHKGLENVYIDTSNICRVFGEEGKLTYRGYWIQDFAQDATYEETVYLLLNGEWPTQEEYVAFRNDLAGRRGLPEHTLALITDMSHRGAMDVLRSAVSSLAETANGEDFDVEQNRERMLDVIAKMPTIIAAYDRARNDQEIIGPNPELSHAANFLYMLHAEEPTEAEARAMNTTLNLYAEHGMNASTFASCVAASTLANTYSALCAGIGALQGPLHGGATETVVQMLDEIGSEANVEDWVDAKLEAHEKIPGFGHRVYKALDPRCGQFAEAYEELAGAEGDTARLELIQHLHEHVVSKLGGKGIYPNADLYSGTVYQTLGINHDLYTCMFTMARAAGWSAHVLEQWDENRILRPRVEYTGEIGKTYVERANRGKADKTEVPA